MKSTSRIIPVLLAAASLAHAQESDNLVPSESTTTLETPTTVRILGEIPDGTPPPPQEPKPEYHIAASDVLSTTTREQGGRTITFRQIKPIDLPPPPVPLESATTELNEEFAQRLAEYREAHPRSHMLFISATVFRSQDAPPLTLVRYWPEGKGGAVTLWSSADFALIAGGINAFVDANGDNYHVMMAWGNMDIDRLDDWRFSKALGYDVAEIPDFSEGKATYQIIGDPPDAEKLAPIQALHDLYNSGYEKLKTAHEGRERARIEREAWLKANPPQPKDITLNFWRTEQPAAKAEGGAK
jgi:hypothetical protein